MAKLTPKQQAFVAEYLVDLNASAAARRAGYSPRTANRIATENLSKPVIAAAIQAALEERSKRTEVTADRVVEELAKIAFANLADYFHLEGDAPRIDLRNLTPEQTAALTEITVDELVIGSDDESGLVRKVKIKMADKLRALDQLAQHLGIAKRVDVTSNGEALPAPQVHIYVPNNGRDPA